MMSDQFLSDASWFFFAIWSVVVGAVSIAAFGRDLVPAKVPVDTPHRSRPSDTARPTES